MAFLTSNHSGESFFSLGNQEITVLCTGTDKRRVGKLRHFVQAVAKHALGSSYSKLVSKICYCILLLFRERLVLVEYIYSVSLLFLIFRYANDGFLVVWHRSVFAFRSVFGHLDRREESFNLSFNLIYVDVTYNNDTLLVWTIPFFIIVAQNLIREVIYYFHQSDRQAISIFTVAQHFGECGIVHT